MTSKEITQYSDAVQKAIDQMMPSDEPLYKADFDVTAYINQLFPTEQSLSQLDEVMLEVQEQMNELDTEIADLVHDQSTVGQDGRHALQEAKTAIRELFTRVREIKAKTDMSETMVKEITRDIKQLDVAKKNLTGSIATLHHLHILLNGVNGLGDWIEHRQYERVAAELPAILNVLVLFEPYMQIEQVKQLADQVSTLQARLAEQVVADFKDAFTKQQANRKQVYDMCRVVSVLDPAVKSELCSWYIKEQLREYALLFDDTEDSAWVDKIEQRYRWIVAKITDMEQRNVDGLFPPDWEIVKRIAAEWCYMTRNMLDRVINKRRSQLDARLLSHAVQVTAKFENMMMKRFPAKPQQGGSAPTACEFVPKPPPVPDTFEHIIRCAFEQHMHVFIDQQDTNLNDFINQCVSRFRQGEDRPSVESTTVALPLPSSSRLFLYYKRAILEAQELSTHPLQLQLKLAVVLKKYLSEYQCRCLMSILQRCVSQQCSSTGNAMSTTAAGPSVSLFQSFLPPVNVSASNAEAIRLSPEDQLVTCCVLATADWCAETAMQLQEKLKEKTSDPASQAQLDMSHEQEQFYQISSHAMSILVQDLEAACDPPLTAMTKTKLAQLELLCSRWATFDAVGDESGFIRAMCQHLKHHVPLIREYLAERRKYFGHLCLKFAQQLVSKYINSLFRCKPCGVTGAEQLLLDTHALKTFLLTMPQVGSSVAPKPPTAYVKVCTKGMAKAEMVLKVVMSPIDSPSSFIEQYRKLLPDSDATELQKILEMKSVRRTEQAPIIDRYRAVTDAYASSSGGGGMAATPGAADNPSLLTVGSLPRVSSQLAMDRENPSQPLMSLAFDTDSRIKKLEKLVKKKL